MSDKTLVERLIESKPVDCEALARIFGIACGDYKTCASCNYAVCCAIADTIEREYLPRPRFEDGEPVQFGDIYTDKHGREWKNGIKSIHIDCNGDFSLHDNTLGNVGRYEVFRQNRFVKRHKPDSLERIEEDALMASIDYCDKYGLLDSECNAEEGDEAIRHCTDCGLTCETRMVKHILRRQREVLERDHER